MKKKLVIPIIMACALSATACVSKDVVEEVTDQTIEASTEVNEEDVSEDILENETSDEAEAETGEETFLNENDSRATFEADAKNMAEDFQTIIADKDMASVATYLNYPCYIGTVNGGITVNTEDEFLSLEVSDVISDALVEAVTSDVISENTVSEAGLVVGAEEGKPNVIFNQDEYGTIGISGINN